MATQLVVNCENGQASVQTLSANDAATHAAVQQAIQTHQTETSAQRETDMALLASVAAGAAPLDAAAVAAMMRQAGWKA